MTFAPLRPKLLVRNISRYDVNILGRVKLRPGEERDLYAELEYNDFGSLTTTVLKELESPSGEIYRLWKVLNAIRIVEFINPTHVGSGVSADSFSTSNAYFEGAVLGFESGELKWLAGGGGGGVSAVTASAPLASSGGSSPNITIGGGALGQVLTSNGGTSPTWEDPPAADWTRSGTVLIPAVSGDTVSIEIPFGTPGLTVEEAAASIKTEVSPANLLLQDNLKQAELSAGTATLRLKGDTGEAVAPAIVAQEETGAPYALDLQILELAINSNVGAAGQVLTSGGPGSAPTWATAAGGSPSAPDGSIQYNDGAGGLGGSSNLAWDSGTNTMTVTGALNIAGGDPRALVVRDISDATEILFYDAAVEALTVQSSISSGIVTIDAANINISDTGHTAQLSVNAGSSVNVDLYVPAASTVVPAIVAKDGALSPVALKLDAAEVDINGTKITNLADGSAPGDAVNLGQLSAMPALGASQNVFWLVEGGKYASLAAAYAAAGEGDVIIIGPKTTGTWGDVTLTENKTMSFIGLNGVNGKNAQIGAVTFSPSTAGLNINRNEHFFSNLMITGSFASQAVLFSGTGAGRLRFSGCIINNTSSSGDGIVNSNTFNVGTVSSIWLDNTTVSVSTTTGAAIRQSGKYTFVKNRCDISGGASAVVLTSGTFECVGAQIEMNGTGDVISATATLPNIASCLIGYSTIKNGTTNGSGVFLSGNGAGLSAGDMAFLVATGTGYCVRGTGTYLYGPVTYSDSVAVAYNVKVQNTLTALPVTTTFTSSP